MFGAGGWVTLLRSRPIRDLVHWHHVASLLFGVQPTDIATIAFVIAMITAVAVIASSLPAWRASRLDPNVVLRDE